MVPEPQSHQEKKLVGCLVTLARKFNIMGVSLSWLPQANGQEQPLVLSLQALKKSPWSKCYSAVSLLKLRCNNGPASRHPEEKICDATPILSYHDASLCNSRTGWGFFTVLNSISGKPEVVYNCIRKFRKASYAILEWCVLKSWVFATFPPAMSAATWVAHSAGWKEPQSGPPILVTSELKGLFIDWVDLYPFFLP